MKQFYSQKYSKTPIIYLLIFYCFYAGLYLFGNNILDLESIWFPLILTATFPVLLYLDSKNISVKFKNEFIEIIDYKSKKGSQVIQYTDIIDIGPKDRFQLGVYIITKNEEYILPSAIDDILGMYNEIRKLEEKGVRIKQSTFSVLIKWYIRSTKYRRFSIPYSLLVIFFFNAYFLDFNPIYQYTNFGISTILFFCFLLLDTQIMKIINRQKNLADISKILQKYNKAPLYLSTAIFICQIVLVLVQIY
jgi:hypothetical protein